MPQNWIKFKESDSIIPRFIDNSKIVLYLSKRHLGVHKPSLRGLQKVRNENAEIYVLKNK